MTPSSVEVLKKAVMEDGDVNAMLAYADELVDHPHADELREMAILANHDDDMASVQLAVSIFFELLKKG